MNVLGGKLTFAADANTAIDRQKADIRNTSIDLGLMD